MYDFDKIIDRHGTNAVKVDRLQTYYGDANLIPLWVADMDFETPPFVVNALRQRMEHPVFGYTKESAGYGPSIIRWLKNLHEWEVKAEWLSYIPGIVKGIGLAVQFFTEKHDKVIIQPPVYHPFRLVPEGNGREVVYNRLKLVNGRYEMDFEQLEQLIDDKCRLLILSNPHNPGGTVWSRETLAALAAICAERRVLVIADEIHADMTLYGNRYTPFAKVSEAAAQNSISFGAPSKTFNIAGLVSSFAVIANDSIRRPFYAWLKANEQSDPTIFAAIATETAYTYGRDWLREMLTYIEGNVDFTDRYMQEHIPAIRVMKPQASFLVWLDCRGLGLNQGDLVELFVKKAGLALNDGQMFGPGGEGFMRMNVGTPRSVLEQALIQLKRAVG
jgi:cystathionine beta-lyase